MVWVGLVTRNTIDCHDTMLTRRERKCCLSWFGCWPNVASNTHSTHGLDSFVIDCGTENETRLPYCKMEELFWVCFSRGASRQRSIFGSILDGIFPSRAIESLRMFNHSWPTRNWSWHLLCASFLNRSFQFLLQTLRVPATQLTRNSTPNLNWHFLLVFGPSMQSLWYSILFKALMNSWKWVEKWRMLGHGIKSEERKGIRRCQWDVNWMLTLGNTTAPRLT